MLRHHSRHWGPARFPCILTARIGTLFARDSPHVIVYRPSARRKFAATRVDEPTLIQFVVLSMLVHVLVIMLFGDASRGGARRGDDLLGALDVTLRRLTPEPGSGFKLAPGAEEPSPGAALLPRPARPTSASPPARAEERAPASPPERRETSIAPPVESGTPTPVEAVPRLNPVAPEELDRPLRPGAVVPPRIERELAPPIEAPARAVPSAPAAPLEHVAPTQIQRELTAPAELPPREIPTAPAIPLERVAPQQVERELAAPAELPPREVPLAPGAPLERTAPPAIEHEMTPPVAVPPRPVPATPGAPLERVAPPKIERPLAPTVEAPLRPAPAPSAEPQSGSTPSTRGVPAENAAPAQRTIPASPPPATAPARPDTLPALRYGTPAAEEDIFKPRPDALNPSAAPGSAPRIDLDAARKRAVRDIANEGSGSRGVLPFPLPVPPPPEKKSKAAQAMEKAIKPDCRTAYADSGLLAVPALIAGAFDNGSCRW